MAAAVFTDDAAGSVFADIDLVDRLEDLKIDSTRPNVTDGVNVINLDSTSTATEDDILVPAKVPVSVVTDGGPVSTVSDGEPIAKIPLESTHVEVSADGAPEGPMEDKPVSAMDAFERLLEGDVDAATEAQAYDAIRWIPFVGDAYSLGRAAYFAMDGDTTEAGLCAMNVIPFVGNLLTTAKRIKDAKDTQHGDANASNKHVPPMYKKLMQFLDENGDNSNQERLKSEETISRRETVASTKPLSNANNGVRAASVPSLAWGGPWVHH